VPGSFVCDDGFPLGAELRRRRNWTSERQQALLSAIAALPERRPSRREKMLIELWAYVRDRESARPASTYVTDDGTRLGRWVCWEAVPAR
jgi:hypothetical protein